MENHGLQCHRSAEMVDFSFVGISKWLVGSSNISVSWTQQHFRYMRRGLFNLLKARHLFKYCVAIKQNCPNSDRTSFFQVLHYGSFHYGFVKPRLQPDSAQSSLR